MKMNRRKDGLYQKSVPYVDRDGIERRKVLYAKTLTELDEKVRIFKNNVEHGIYAHKDLTLGLYADRWLESAGKHVSEKTQEGNTATVNKIKDGLGSRALSSVKKSDIQALVDKYSDQPRTAQLVRQITSRIFKSAIADDLLYKNPCDNVRLPKYEKQEKRALRDYEVKALKEADFTQEERLFVSVLYYTGLRRGETLALSRRDIDIKKSVIHVRHSLSFVTNTGVLKTPKTKNSVRDVPIPTDLVSLLKDYSDSYDLYLFTRDGKLFTKSAFDVMWKKILEKMNKVFDESGTVETITGLTAHVFRHNYATKLCLENVPMKAAQKILGHASITTTMNVYTHIQGLENDTVEKINRAFQAS